MVHSVHYILELQLLEDKKKWYVFAQGISPLFYRLEGIKYFRIYKQWIDTTEFQKKNLTWKFVRFQQSIKERYRLKKRFFKHLRCIETGEVTFQQLTYLE